MSSPSQPRKVEGPVEVMRITDLKKGGPYRKNSLNYPDLDLRPRRVVRHGDMIRQVLRRWHPTAEYGVMGIGGELWLLSSAVVIVIFILETG